MEYLPTAAELNCQFSTEEQPDRARCLSYWQLAGVVLSKANDLKNDSRLSHGASTKIGCNQKYRMPFNCLTSDPNVSHIHFHDTSCGGILNS
jgi:hypothetical protein